LFVGSAIFTFGGTQGVSLTLALVAIVIGWIAACLALSGMRHDRISIAWRLGVTLAVWSPGIAAMAMLVVFAMFVSRNPAAQRAALEAAELSPLKAARQSVKTNSTPGSWTVTNSFAGQSSPKTLKLTGEPKQNLTAGTKASCWMVHIDGTPVLLITGQGSTPSSSGASGKGKIKTEIKFRDATLDVSIDGGNEVNINGSVYDLTKGRVMMVGTDGRITQIDRPLDHLLETTEIDNFVSELEAVEVEEVAKLVIKAAHEDNHGDLRKLCSRRLLEIVDSDGDPGKNLGMLKRLKFTRILWVKDDLAKAVMVHYAEGREAEFDPTMVREEEVELDFVREDGLWKLAPSS
jgi:hypothetical protein